LILRIIEIVATRCRTQFDFGWRFAPDPAGELTALPKALAGFKGLTSREREEEEGQEKGRERQWMEWKGTGGEERRRGWRFSPALLISMHRRCRGC